LPTATSMREMTKRFSARIWQKGTKLSQDH
jgi:hypothetical protein